MNKETFKTLLNNLRPETIAHIVVDLENAHEDWAFYPEEAPPESVREMIDESLALIITAGDKRAEEKDLKFRQIIDRIRRARDDEEWAKERDEQERKNWLDDYK